MTLSDSLLALQIDADTREELRFSNPDGHLFEIKPYKESDRGIQDTIEMYRSLHEVDEWRGFNTSPTNAFELWFDGEHLRLMMYIGDDDHVRRAIRHITSNFPSAHIVTPSEAHNDVMLPDIGTDEYVAGARLNLAMHFFAPIRNPDGVEPFHAPYRNIAAEIVNDEEVKEVVQVLFKPAGTDWTSSRYTDAAAYAERLTADINIDTLDASKDETASAPGEMRQAASNIKQQIGQPGFYISLRVLCISEDKDKAIQQMNDISTAFHNYYREHTGQTFIPVPQKGHDIHRLLTETLARDGRRMIWPQGFRHRNRIRNGKSCETIIMTFPELAGLAHIPNEDHLDTAAVDWVVLDSSHRLPAQAPKYEENKGEPDDADTIPWQGAPTDDETPSDDDDTPAINTSDDDDDTPRLPDDDTAGANPPPQPDTDDAEPDTATPDDDHRWPVKPDDDTTDED